MHRVHCGAVAAVVVVGREGDRGGRVASACFILILIHVQQVY